MLYSDLSPAGAALFRGTGIGLGDLLADQVTDETEALRKKRLLEQQRGLTGPGGSLGLGGSPIGSVLGGLAQ